MFVCVAAFFSFFFVRTRLLFCAWARHTKKGPGQSGRGKGWASRQRLGNNLRQRLGNNSRQRLGNNYRHGCLMAQRNLRPQFSPPEVLLLSPQRSV